RPAIPTGADRVVELQRTEAEWEGTWFWYVGSTYNATNLTGATALGLLEAYRDTKDSTYLASCIDAANFIMTHLGVWATGTQHYPRPTAFDIVFLHHLSGATGDPQYAARATLEWDNITLTYPTAGSLDALFRAISRRSAWDFAYFLEAAHLSGDTTWAADAAAFLADTSDTFYYSDLTGWYALNLSGAIKALVGCGYGDLYYDAVVEHLYNLIAVSDKDNGVDGWIQDTAYAVLAFKTVGGAATAYANNLAKWIALQQEENGGWIEAGDEYPEINGEALRALSATIGTNVTLFKLKGNIKMNSSWRRAKYPNSAGPFSGK
ncbi:hypothetical protein ACFLRW_07405, partial [Acidobacteriota bacterium]